MELWVGCGNCEAVNSGTWSMFGDVGKSSERLNG
jgi:hypothetical protein